MAKRKKRKSWRNYTHAQKQNQEEIDLNLADTEKLRTRDSYWRERIEQIEDGEDAGYDPDQYVGYPLGTVLNMQSGHHYVRLEETGETVDCEIRGILKRGLRNTTTVAAPGDKVHIERISDEKGQVVAVVPRTSALSRPAPMRPHLQDIIVANIDQIIIVSSLGGPAFWPELVDRYLVFAEYYGMSPLIVVNKIDQAQPGEFEAIRDLYEGQLGYRILFTSADDGTGIDDLKALMKDRFSVVTGLSGVGKSSLLNAIQVGLNITVKSVNLTYGGEGKHTTRSTTLHPLDFGGYVADTPGIHEFGLWDLTPEELDYYFLEFRPLIEACKFNDCTHHDEPECAITDALESGEIALSRYESYQILFNETSPEHERPY